MDIATHHKLCVTLETGPGRTRTALVTSAQRPKPAELTVRADCTATSPAVCENRQVEERERDERKEERTGGGEWGDEGDRGPLAY